MPLNPLERRLLTLRGEWEAFRAQSGKRLLIWKIGADALRVIQCFFEAQKQEVPYATGDLFIVFDAAFEDSIQYSKALKAALAGHYEASREELEEQGIAPDWNADPAAFPDSAAGFMQMLRSFGSKHHRYIGHLVAVFMPASVASDDAFAAWLGRCLRTDPPERLRLVLIDAQEGPRFEELARADQASIETGRPAIDALCIARECFAHDGAVGPAALFRNHLIDLAVLLEKGSASEVKARALDAYAFARRQGWPDQEVVVQMLVAGGFLKDKQFDSALKAYQAARQSAARAEANGHPAGPQLVLQTWFGEAGARLAAGEPAQAVPCYDEAARIAQRIPNLILAIEASRMSAFCLASIGHRDAAIERGLEAFAQAERLKPDARPMTTLPLAGIDLLRAIEPQRVKALERVSRGLTARVAEAREKAERRAAELESSGDARQLQAVEQRLAREIDQAGQAAAEELDSIGLGAEPQFRDAYAKLRELLAASWPEALLDTLAMLSPASSTAGKAGASAA